jgi:glycosyltransferase involved in cell wall biosynthesis
LRIYNILDLFSLRFCNKIIAVSEGIRDDLIKHGIRPSKIVAIQNAVEKGFDPMRLAETRLEKRKALGVSDGEYVAGYVGRLSAEKGVQYLIEAASILKGKGAQFRMLIIGDGPKRKELENLTVEKGLAREHMFVGFQNDIENWLPVLDVFVLPSLTEGTPMALLEAMAIGLPVIASDVGGVPELVENGVSGFLIPPGDSAALAEKLSTLCRNRSVRETLGQAAINATKNHCNVLDWSRQIEKEYEFLIAKT